MSQDPQPELKSSPLRPGSREAILQGCTCPVLDNSHGNGLYTTKEGSLVFVMSQDCPLHGNTLKS